MSADLVERVLAIMFDMPTNEARYLPYADKANAIICVVVEECAAVVDDLVENDPLLLPRVASAIRALSKDGEG